VSRLSLAFLFLAGAAGLAPAQTAAHQPTALAWVTKRIEQRAEFGQERTEAVFKFHNAGSQPVTITAVESSCGCTTARIVKTLYAAGDTGEIRALFDFGERTGPQQKVLTVHTNDSQVATQLVLYVEIPEAIALNQTVLHWERDEQTVAKTLFARTPASGVEITGLSFDAAQVDAKFAPAPGGGGYVITLRPLKTAAMLRQSVRIDAIAAGQPRTAVVYVFVR
jgi:hypothetical protein